MKFDIARYPYCIINLRTREEAEVFEKYLNSIGEPFRKNNPNAITQAWSSYGGSFGVNYSQKSFGSCRYYRSRSRRILSYDMFDWSEYESIPDSDELDNFLKQYVISR